MNKMKQIFKYFLLFLIFIGVGVFIDVVVFNYKILFLESDEKIIEIDNYTEEIVDDNKKIIFQLDNNYVDKLKITYLTETDVPFVLNYQDEDYYGNLEDNIIYDTLDNEVTEAFNNIRGSVGKIEIVYDNNFNIEIESIIVENELELNIFRIFFITIVLILIYILYRFYKKGCNENKIHRYFMEV